jgi:histidinol-phosphate aminotransferase
VGLLQLGGAFARLGLEQVPSVANFILVRVGDGQGVFRALQGRGVIVRPVKSYGLPEWVRVTVGNAAQNERVILELERVLSARPRA